MNQFNYRQICSTGADDKVSEWLKPCLGKLAKAYSKIVQHVGEGFFGLRDFYRYMLDMHGVLCKQYSLNSLCFLKYGKNALLDVQSS